jgi:hypothetical protein
MTSELRQTHSELQEFDVEAVMSAISDRLLFWSPRILGVLVSMFLGVFALDAFSPAKPILAALPDFLVHLTPAVVVLGLVIVSWTREWIGGLAFIALAVMYGLTVGREHGDWVLVISGPLLIVGALFLWSWQHRRILAATE